MKSAIIETGGKQYRITPGETISIEKLGDKKAGDALSFDKVLLLDDGKETKIGAPYIEGAVVEAELVEEGRNKKISVIRFKSKTRYHKKKGHRQPFAKIKIAG